jgi:hypothetical protein
MYRTMDLSNFVRFLSRQQHRVLDDHDHVHVHVHGRGDHVHARAYGHHTWPPLQRHFDIFLYKNDQLKKLR